MDSGLKGKNVLITGASGGIGYQTSLSFEKEEANLILHYNKNKTSIDNLSKEIKAKSLVVQADLCSEEQVEQMFKTIDDKVGKIDVLVCNAGFWPREHVLIKDMSLKRWNDTIEVDLTSVFLCCRGFLKNLDKYKGDYGSIVMIGSTAAIFGEAYHADYSTTKAGFVYGLNRSLKNEIVHIAKYGRVNVVCPGWTVTPMARESLKNTQLVEKIQKTMPLRKLGNGDDIANTIVYLASDKLSGHISGEIITVAGGMEGRVLWD